MALTLASVALVASTNLLVAAVPIEQAASARPQWDSEWDNEWDNDDDDDEDDDEYNYGGYGRRYRNRGYRYGLGNWFNRQNNYYGRGYRSWNKRAVASTQHQVRSAQQGPWNPLSIIGNLLGGGRRDRDDDEPKIIYVPLPAGYPNGYAAQYPGQIPNYPAGYQIPYPAQYPGAYPVAYYPPQGAGVGISGPLYAPGAQGAVRPQPKGWPPVVGGNGYPVGNVGFGIGSAGFTVDGPRPTPAPYYPGYPVGPGRPATGITATLPGGVGNVGLGPISGGFSVDGGVVTPAPAPPRPTPVGPPAAGITGTLSNGNTPVGEVGLGIGSAGFSVGDGNTAATPMPAMPAMPSMASPEPVVPSPEPVIPVASPVAPSPVAPPASGVTGTLTNGNNPVGEVGLGIGGASFSVDGNNNVAPSAAPPAIPVDGGVVTPAPAPTPAPARPIPTPIAPSPVAPPAAGVTGTLTNGNTPVGEVGLGIGGASFSVDGSNNVAPSAAPPAVPVDGGVVTPAPAPTPAPARPGGIVATLSKGANPVGVAGLGIGGSSFSVGN